MKKRVVFRVIRTILVVLVLLAVVLGVLWYIQQQNALNALSQMPSYTFRQVSRGDVEIGVTAKGSVTSATATSVVLDWAGKVKSVPFEVGDIVAAGDLVAIVEDDDLDSSIAAANNTLRQQEIALQKQLDDLEKTINAPVTGRVKVIRAEVGEDASTTSGTWGQLCWISPDGMMELTCLLDYEVEPEYKLWVEDERGVRYEARVTAVDQANAKKATMEIYDDRQLDPGDHVRVFRDEEDVIFGEGDVTIKNAVQVTGTGKITQIHVENNQEVVRGQLMFSLDTQDAYLTYESQTISVEDAQRKLEDLRADLGKSELYAPVGGVITELTLSEGQNAAAGATVARIQSVESLQTIINVDELDIAKVQEGQSVKLTLEALEGKIYNGVVSKIAVIGTISNNFATYPVTIDIENPGEIKIGMSCEATIQIEAARDTLTLPVEMLQRSRDGYNVSLVISGLDTGAAYEREMITETENDAGENLQRQGGMQQRMQQMQQNMFGGASTAVGDALSQGVQTELREVTVGLINEDYAQILSGLDEGDWVAIESTSSGSMDMMMMGGGPNTMVEVGAGGDRFGGAAPAASGR